MQHVVWDWNGTLFDDFPLVLAAANAASLAVDGPPITLDDYRARFTRPVRRFYEIVLDRSIDDPTWALLDDAFHDHYHGTLDTAALAVDAPRALDRVAATGATQSILSMWRHDQLEPFVARLGIADRFSRVDGLRGTGGGPKAPHLARHLDALGAPHGALDRARVVMIGDTLDDAHAAADNGIACVLHVGGEHGPDSLRTAGVPIASSLLEALDLAGLPLGP